GRHRAISLRGQTLAWRGSSGPFRQPGATLCRPFRSAQSRPQAGAHAEPPHRLSCATHAKLADRKSAKGGITMLTAIIVACVIGAIAGWLAGLLVQGTGFGLVGDIVVGILGALIAAWLFPALGIALTIGGGLLGSIILAFIGAVILLVVVRLIKQIT